MRSDTSVSIPKWCDCKLRGCLPFFYLFCFNSKMVRLQEVIAAADKIEAALFQFQNGAIARTRQKDTSGLFFTSFNSKMVRLQAFQIPAFPLFVFGFNSKMVRLQDSMFPATVMATNVSIPKWCDCKVTFGTGAGTGPSVFQFQNGAIASQSAGASR